VSVLARHFPAFLGFVWFLWDFFLDFMGSKESGVVNLKVWFYRFKIKFSNTGNKNLYIQKTEL
jgi:hypothetical protein